MIFVTRLNGDKMTINALYIETVEATPDTLIGLTSGNKMMVRESVDEVVDRVQVYMRSIGAARASVMVQGRDEGDV